MATLKQIALQKLSRPNEAKQHEPWDVPLDWDLHRVNDQLARWRREHSALRRMMWVVELDTLKALSAQLAPLAQYYRFNNKHIRMPHMLDHDGKKYPRSGTWHQIAKNYFGHMFGRDELCEKIREGLNNLVQGKDTVMTTVTKAYTTLDDFTTRDGKEYFVEATVTSIEGRIVVVNINDDILGVVNKMAFPFTVQFTCSQFTCIISQLRSDIEKREHELTRRLREAGGLTDEERVNILGQVDVVHAQHVQCQSVPLDKAMEDVIQKMEGRLKELSLRSESEDSFACENSQVTKFFQCQIVALKECCLQKDSIIADIAQEKKDLQERYTQMRICNAVLEERCKQNGEIIASMDQEIKSLKGELADMRYVLQHPTIPKRFGEHGQQLDGLSGSEEDGLFKSGSGEELPTGLAYLRPKLNSGSADAEGSSEYASSVSSRSWISVGIGPHCFPSNPTFKTLSGDTEHFLKVEHLRKGSHVLADDGETVVEVLHHPEQFETDRLVELRTGAAILYVTPDHRIPVPDGSGASRDVFAPELKSGDLVFEDGVPEKLTSVKEICQFSLVWKVAFKPDMAVAVFIPPPAISSKGHARKHLRRSGMNRRGKPGIINEDAHCSMPDTADGDVELPDVCKIYCEPC